MFRTDCRPCLWLTLALTMQVAFPMCVARGDEPVADLGVDQRAEAWEQTSVDRFILRQLQEAKLQPSPRADRRTLIRRVTLDLTGLLPSEAEVERFVSDPSPQAWAQLVDRLLASPRYGERWGQHWLDVVRYADSDGFEYDDPRPHAWRYRDWVIRSFNEDKRFSRFVQEQLAGDELFPGNISALTATGLQTLGPLRLNAGMQDEAKNRQEVLTEMTDLIGSAFLGLTIGCARCHDHKFEDFTQEDYYQLQAFFAATKAMDRPLASKAEQAQYDKKLQQWKDQLAALSKEIESAEGEQREKLVARKVALTAKKPAPLPSIRVATDQLSPVPATFVLNRGEPGDRLHQVQPRFPAMLADNDSQATPAIMPRQRAGVTTPGRRSALAKWLADERHPLAARVFANRIWKHLVGHGIVTTPNDFGVMGHDPTHPDLLDWLAAELHRGGIKHLQRQILLSATYQQASRIRADGQQKDPHNTLLWRMNRRRMEAEVLRDTILQLSGQLNEQAGGPGVRLPLHPEIAKLQYKGTWNAAVDVAQYGRRTIYVFLKRNNRVPFLEIFDAPSTMVSCGQRSESSHAGQALAMLNGEFVQNHARQFAAQVDSSSSKDLPTRITRAFKRALARPPTDVELRQSIRFLEGQAKGIAVEAGRQKVAASDHQAAWNDFALVLLNLDEFAFIE